MNTSLYEKAKKIRFNALLLSRLMKSGRFYREFRMRGLSFDSIRDYIPGDDIRFIDWNAAARFGKPYVKEFVEDSNVPIMLMVDVSASVSASRSVFEKIQECALLMLYAGMHQNIPVGCVLFGLKESSEAPHGFVFIKPEAGNAHYHRIETMLLSYEPSLSGESRINEALAFTNKNLHPGALIFVMSDFFIAGYKELFAMLKTLHSVVAVRFLNNSTQLPRCALHCRDAESRNSYLLLPGRSYVQRAVRERTLQIESELYAVCTMASLLEISPEQDVFILLLNFLKRRIPV